MSDVLTGFPFLGGRAKRPDDAAQARHDKSVAENVQQPISRRITLINTRLTKLESQGIMKASPKTFSAN
jgi:hypothetical protein